MINCIYNLNIDLTLVATLITAIATLGTVWEMKRQRETSSRPELLIRDNKRFYLYQAVKTFGETNKRFTYWHENRLENIESVESVFERTFEIDIFNIGTGTAKNVQLDYEFDSSAYKALLMSFKTVSVDKLEVDQQSVSFEGNIAGEKIGNDGPMQSFHLIIPNSAKEPFKSKLPEVYLYLVNTFVISIINKTPKDWNGFNLPSLILKATYQDTSNKIYKKTFHLTFSIDSLSKSTNSETLNVSGIIKVNEIN